MDNYEQFFDSTYGNFTDITDIQNGAVYDYQNSTSDDEVDPSEVYIQEYGDSLLEDEGLDLTDDDEPYYRVGYNEHDEFDNKYDVDTRDNCDLYYNNLHEDDEDEDVMEAYLKFCDLPENEYRHVSYDDFISFHYRKSKKPNKTVRFNANIIGADHNYTSSSNRMNKQYENFFNSSNSDIRLENITRTTSGDSITSIDRINKENEADNFDMLYITEFDKLKQSEEKYEDTKAKVNDFLCSVYTCTSYDKSPAGKLISLNLENPYYYRSKYGKWLFKNIGLLDKYIKDDDDFDEIVEKITFKILLTNNNPFE